MRTVHTRDENERIEFKERLANKVITSAVTESLAPQTRSKIKVNVPVNFSDLGEAYIHQTLLNSKLTAEQSREICGFLFADQQTESFELEVVITRKQDKPATTIVEAEPKTAKTYSLELPYEFNKLAVKDQYLWLSKQSNFGLSLEEVNDVIDIVAGNPARSGSGTSYDISFCQYELPVVTYEPSPKKKKANLRAAKAKKPEYSLDSEKSRTHIDVTLPENFSSLKEYERHSVLVNSFQLFADEASEILTLFRDSGETEFTVFRPEATPEEKIALEAKVIDLVLPYGFLTVSDAHKYKYLQTLLSPAQAQEAMAVLNGTQQATNVKFNISYSKEVVQDGNPVEEYITRRRETLSRIKADYAGYELATDGVIRTVNVTIPETFNTLPESERQRYLTTTFKLFPGEAAEILKNLRAHPELDEFVVERPEPKAKAEPVKAEPKVIDVTLPAEFSAYAKKKQYDYLRFVSKLTTEQSEDILSLVHGLIQKSSDIFNISYAPAVTPITSDPVKDFIAQRVLRAEETAKRLEQESLALVKPEAKPKTRPAIELRTVDVELPYGFNVTKPSEQYLYLQTILNLSPEDSSDVIAVLQGQKARGNTEFSISYSEPKTSVDNPVQNFITQRALKAEATARRFEADKRATELSVKPKAEPKVVEPVPVRTLAVNIPKNVFSIDPSQQYLYFTRELKMLPDEATQLVASIGGMDTPIVFKVTIEE